MQRRHLVFTTPSVNVKGVRNQGGEWCMKATASRMPTNPCRSAKCRETHVGALLRRSDEIAGDGTTAMPIVDHLRHWRHSRCSEIKSIGVQTSLIDSRQAGRCGSLPSLHESVVDFVLVSIRDGLQDAQRSRAFVDEAVFALTQPEKRGDRHVTHFELRTDSCVRRPLKLKS
jgi:hypothetical protein